MKNYFPSLILLPHNLVINFHNAFHTKKTLVVPTESTYPKSTPDSATASSFFKLLIDYLIMILHQGMNTTLSQTNYSPFVQTLRSKVKSRTRKSFILEGEQNKASNHNHTLTLAEKIYARKTYALT